MTTTTVKSIGSGGGRDYSTISAWEAGCPANLVTNDEIWKGECYNDSEFLNNELQVSGVTTDSTRYMWLTCASGQSFKDDAGAATLPLKYDQSKGVGFRFTGNYRRMVDGGSANLLIEGIQYYYDTTYGSVSFVPFSGGTTHARNCLMQTRQTAQLFVYNADVLTNCVLISLSASGSPYMVYGPVEARNCTVVRPTGLAAGTPIAFSDAFSSYPLVKNCAVFGFGTAFANTLASYAAGSGYNATDVSAAPGSSNQVSKTFSSQFEDVTNAAQDWRPKSGGDLANNGTPDTTYTSDLDVIGAARSGSTPTIGAREFAGGGPPPATSLVPPRRFRSNFSAYLR